MRRSVVAGITGLVVAFCLAGCGEAPLGSGPRDEPGPVDTTSGVGVEPTLASSTSTSISTTTTLSPAPVVSSWDNVARSADAADAYALAQADYAGTWLDDDLEVLYYAFTGNVPHHADEMRALGVDLDSGFFELRKATQSWDDLTAAFDAAMADSEHLAAQWHVVEIRPYAWHSIVAVVVDETVVTAEVDGVPATDWDRLAELASYLGDTYGSAAWEVIPGTSSTLPDWEASISTVERTPTAAPIEVLAGAPTTTTATTSSAPVQTVSSWGYIYDFTDTADRYAEEQPEYAGTWVDEDLEVLYYAFSGNIPHHEAQMRALGVDMDSGFYELRRAYLSLAELETAFDEMKADKDTLRQDWDILGFNTQVVHNLISVVVDEQKVVIMTEGTPALDIDRLTEIEDYLSEAYGLTRWSIGPGRETTWDTDGATL